MAKLGNRFPKQNERAVRGKRLRSQLRHTHSICVCRLLLAVKLCPEKAETIHTGYNYYNLGGHMFWTGLVIGVIVGANVGIVMGCLLAWAKRNDLEAQLESSLMDVAVMEELPEEKRLAPLPSQVAYADSNPYVYSQNQSA